MSRIENFILDPEVKVYAGPFESTIGKMVRSGWKFETDYDAYNYTSRIYGKSDYGVFSSAGIADGQIKSTKHFPFLHIPAKAVVNAKHIVERMELPVMPLMSVDVGQVYPSTSSGIMEVMYYEKQQIVVPEKNDVLITPEDIPELLQKIQKAQKPRAREILAAQRKRDGLNEYKVQAKILSFK